MAKAKTRLPGMTPVSRSTATARAFTLAVSIMYATEKKYERLKKLTIDMDMDWTRRLHIIRS